MKISELKEKITTSYKNISFLDKSDDENFAFIGVLISPLLRVFHQQAKSF